MVFFSVSSDMSLKHNLNRRVFLTSDNRIYSRWASRPHHNDYETRLALPIEFFKGNFFYDRSAQIYRNDIQWKDLAEYMTVISLAP